MSAIKAALDAINDVGQDGDLTAETPGHFRACVGRTRRSDRAARRQADLPAEAARRADRRIACALLDMQRAEPVAVPAADRPARHGQEPDRARDRLPAVAQRGRAVETRSGEPFYGYAEMSGGPSSDEFTFRYEYVPDSEHARRRAADPGRVRGGDGARLGGDDRRGQHDPRRRAAVAQRHARRTAVALPARRGPHRDRRARVRGADRLQPRAGRRQRHPRRLALALPGHRRGHQQLAGARQARRRRAAREGRDGARRQALRPGDGAGVDAAVPRHRGALRT